MFDRLKLALVESFIGAIALGYLFAQAILYFVNIFTTPFALLATRNVPRTPAFLKDPLEAALRPVIAFVVLLLVWYVLLRWLYFTPPKKDASEAAPNPKQAA